MLESLRRAFLVGSVAAGTSLLCAKPCGEVTFDCDFPGGNVRVLEYDSGSNKVTIESDYRDSMTDWFWTYFRVRGAAGRRLVFRFRPDRPTHRMRVSRAGMAYSTDEGKSWHWTAPDGRHKDPYSFAFDFPLDATSVRFATSIPYLRNDLDAFCKAHPEVRVTTLTRSRKGRDVPLLSVGSADAAEYAFVFTARHHASEVTASWAMEGMAEAASADTPEGHWLRANAHCLFVPFMDTDGCEDGDPGKNRSPHDHNRDYRSGLYPEVRAFQELVRAETRCRPIVFFDMHAPQVRGTDAKPRHDNVFTMGPPPAMEAYWNDYRRRLVEATRANSLKFLGRWDEPWMTDYNIPAKNPDEQKSHDWILEQTNVLWVATFEFGYGLCGGVVSREGLRELGRAMMNVLARQTAACGQTPPPPWRHVLVRDFRTVKDGQVVNFNIGTAAHGPATIAALSRKWPGTKFSLWADAPLEPCLARMMSRRFPDVRIFAGPNVPDTDAEVMVIGSGSSIAGSVQRSIPLWRKKTGRPVGAYAIGYQPEIKRLTSSLDFCYFRDTAANALAEKTGGAPRRHGFRPDAVFDFDAVDEQAAAAFLADKGLVAGRFVCAIPGERYTARWTFFGTPPDARKAVVNAAKEISDNAVVCAAVVEAVRKHGMKALLCAEQRSEMPLVRRALLDRLPDDVRGQCATLDEFWPPDLALGVFAKSRCVFGLEMHSQVMALGRGIPACVFRHKGFGTKSGMLSDLGMGDWCLDIDEPAAVEKAAAMVGAILSDPVAAMDRCKVLRRRVDSYQFLPSSFAK